MRPVHAAVCSCFQVEELMRKAEPWTQSVTKRASRLSLAATDFASRALGRKIHMK